MSLQHKFVEFIPEKVEEGILYISIEYCTAIHKCLCGCGNEVVTPLSPTDWRLTFNGKSITLYPSIGNWNFECKSHYWIRNNKIEFAGSWTEREIRLGREKDIERKTEYFEMPDIPKEEPVVQESQKSTIWQKISKLFRLWNVNFYFYKAEGNSSALFIIAFGYLILIRLFSSNNLA